jgi:hypothetical protein
LGDLPSEALLALTSILLATVGTAFAANFLADLTEPLKSLRLPFLLGLVGSVATGLALLLFIRVRERSVETKRASESGALLEGDAEQQIMRKLSLAAAPFNRRLDIDFIVRMNKRTVGIELKKFLPQSDRVMKLLVGRMEALRGKYELDLVYLVFAPLIPTNLKSSRRTRQKS